MKSISFKSILDLILYGSSLGHWNQAGLRYKLILDGLVRFKRIYRCLLMSKCLELRTKSLVSGERLFVLLIMQSYTGHKRINVV